MAQLVIDGLVADGDALLKGPVGGVNGRLNAEDDLAHQLDQGGEEQLVGILVLSGLGEDGIDVLRVQEALQDGAGHDTDGPLLQKRLKHRIKKHSGSKENGGSGYLQLYTT